MRTTRQRYHPDYTDQWVDIDIPNMPAFFHPNASFSSAHVSEPSASLAGDVEEPLDDVLDDASSRRRTQYFRW